MRSSRSACQNTRMKPWLILPFHFICLHPDPTTNAAAFGSRKQMELCPSSDQKKKKKNKRGSSGLVCSLRLRQLLPALFPGQPPNRGASEGGSESSKETLPWGIGVSRAEQLTFPALGITDQGEAEKEGREDTYVTPPSPSVPSSLSRSLTQEALAPHYPPLHQRMRGGFREELWPADAAHRTRQSPTWMSSRSYLNTTVTADPSAFKRQLVTVSDGRLGVAWMCLRSLTVPLLPCNRLCLKSAWMRLNKREEWESFGLRQSGVSRCCKIWELMSHSCKSCSFSHLFI